MENGAEWVRCENLSLEVIRIQNQRVKKPKEHGRAGSQDRETQENKKSKSGKVISRGTNGLRVKSKELSEKPSLVEVRSGRGPEAEGKRVAVDLGP